MAQSPGEEGWREAWVGSPHVGKVELVGEEIVVRCAAVSAKHGADATILDDGRTVGVCQDDWVAFGVIAGTGKAPVAVNVWRTEPPPAAKRRRTGGAAQGLGGREVPAALQGELVGLVRNQSQNTGDYFVDCPAVFEAYGRDAKIKQYEMPRGIEIGQAIAFEVLPPPPHNETLAPLAKAIRKAEGPAAEEALKAGFSQQRPPASFGGCFNCGGDHFARDCTEKGKGKGKGKGGKSAPRRAAVGEVMRMVGLVKKPSPISGRHLIFCQDISEVYAKDAQIPTEEVPEGGLQIGDRISFDVEEPGPNYKGAPLARNVSVIASRAAAGAAKIPGRPGAVAYEGDGEEEAEEVEIEEMEDEGPEQAEEPAIGQEELEEVEASERLEAQLSRDSEREAVARPRNRRQAAGRAAPMAGGAAAVDTTDDPDTTEGWVAAQEEIFGSLPKLRRGWVRIRSKSTGLVYYYNVDSGQSTHLEPRQ